MALIVEDGSSVANADSYVTLAEADTYCQNRNYTSWMLLTDPIKEAAIRRAMLFIEPKNWKGYKASETNSLEWPRKSVVDKNGYSIDNDDIPTNLKFALIEASYRESVTAGTLMPDISRDARVKRKKVDVLETEYFDYTWDSQPSFAIIDGLLTGLIYDSTRLMRC